LALQNGQQHIVDELLKAGAKRSAPPALTLTTTSKEPNPATSTADTSTPLLVSGIT
jgi:hypothetical protein